MDERPTHLDLFSGIGGFALAAQCAGFRTLAFVERNEFCVQRLGQIWPSIPIFSDIRHFGGRPFRGIDILTGGFPCQPFSNAGEQRGAEDDRYLWPEMLRVIQTTEPHWIVGENVTGIDGLGLDDCISNLEAIGYEVAPPLEIPACSVGANHPRARIWIVAHDNRQRKPQLQRGKPNVRGWHCNGTPEAGNVAHPAELHGRSWDLLEASGEWRALLEPRRLSRDEIYPGWEPTPKWFECEPGLVRLVHGIPDRTHRLEALGNAIVPQVAYQIIKAIYAQIKGAK